MMIRSIPFMLECWQSAINDNADANNADANNANANNANANNADGLGDDNIPREHLSVAGYPPRTPIGGGG